MSSISLATLIFFAGYICGALIPFPGDFDPVAACLKREEVSVSYPRSAMANPYLTEPISQNNREDSPPEQKIILAQKDFRTDDQNLVAKKAFLQIVEEEPCPVFKSDDEISLKKLYFTILAGSFSDKKEAEEQRETLKRRGHDPQKIYPALSREQKWYNILIGNYKSMEEASRAVSRFNEKESMMTAVVASISKKQPSVILADAFLKQDKGRARENARKLIARLNETAHFRKYRAHPYTASDSKGQKWETVLLNHDLGHPKNADQIIALLRDEAKQIRAEVTYKEEARDSSAWKIEKSGVAIRSIREILDSFPPPESWEPHPYTIQLASYVSERSARQGLLRFERQSLSAYLGRKGKWWIAYMGRYKTREEAEKVRKESRKTIRKTTRRSDAVVRERPYANFIGKLSSDNKKTPEFQKLESLGYHPYFVEDAEHEFRLFVGNHSTREEAEKQNLKLKAKGISGQVAER